MKRLLFSLLLVKMACSMLIAQEYLTIGMASKPVLADGIIDSNDPWDSVWIKQLKMTGGSLTTDMQSEFQLKYDSTNLYFAVKVKDATRFTGCATTYMNDCVWFFIAMDTSSQMGAYKTGDNNMRLQAVADQNTTGGAIEGMFGVQEHGKYVCVDNGDNYVQEWVMPWDELSYKSGQSQTQMDPAWDGEGFKFDVGTTDATSDGMRTQLMFWNDNSDLQWNNTTHFGYIRLNTPILVDPRSDQFIIFDEIPAVNFGIDIIELSAYSNSGLPVSYSSSNTDIAFVNGNILYITGIGSTTITASQNGTNNFKPAIPVSREFVVMSSGTNPVKLIIPIATKAPVIDGVIDANDPWGPGWIKQLQMADFSSTFDTQSEFQLMYDSVNLYFAVRVNDTSRFVDNEMNYLNDCVWLFIAMDSTSGNGEYKTGDRHLSLRAVSDPDASGGSIEFLKGGSVDGQFVCVDSGYCYIQEWKMPWSELSEGMYPLWDGKGLKIDVGTGDCTSEGQRTQLMFWNDNSDLQWNNTRYFGYVALNNEVFNDFRTDQYINWSTLPEVRYGDEDVELTAWSTSGLPLIYTSSNPDVATINNNKIQITGIGETTITARQEGNISFRPAFPVSLIFKVRSDIISDIILFDFEKQMADTSWSMFGNGAYQNQWDKSVIWNPEQTGVNTSENVLQFLVHYDANPWVGMFTDYLDEPIQITENAHTFTMMVYKSVIGPVGLKVENSSDGVHPTEVLVENTRINEWEKLSFELSDAIGHSFNRLTVFPDFPPTREDSAYVLLDNISFGGPVGLVVNLTSAVNINCGDSYILNPEIDYHGSGDLEYSWFPGDGLSESDIADPVVKTSETRKYTLTVSSPDFGEVIKSVWINVNPISLYITKVNGYCGNTEQIYGSTNYSGNAAINYYWYPSTGLSATDIPAPYVGLIADTWYMLYIVTEDGCTAMDSVLVKATGTFSTPSICMVTVNENDNNVIVIKQDPDIQVDSFLIYRESQYETDLYDLIAVLPNSGIPVFVDSESNARVQSYKYKIAVKDICGFISGYSAPHKTIHLTGIGTNGNLIWEPYAGIPVKSYKIYRGTKLSDLSQIGSTSGSNISFTDIDAPSGNVLYLVEGIISEPCSASKSSEFTGIRSNIFSNSTLPDGTNAFKLSGDFIFPNPAKDKLNVISGFSPDAKMIILNLNGKTVITSEVSEQIDISGLSKGIYIIKLIDSGKILINKLIKE